MSGPSRLLSRGLFPYCLACLLLCFPTESKACVSPNVADSAADTVACVDERSPTDQRQRYEAPPGLAPDSRQDSSGSGQWRWGPDEDDGPISSSLASLLRLILKKLGIDLPPH